MLRLAEFGGRDRLVGLTVVAGISWLIYLAIALSAQSLHEAVSGRHSLLVLLALFGGAILCYAVAIPLAKRAEQGKSLLMLIVAAAVLFRVTALFSNPIEEVDLYRYLWDGAVVNEGVNPFKYAPQQVLAPSPGDELPDDLARLVRLRERSPEMSLILKRVHFGELPTIYPPVAQAVFAFVTALTPATGSLYVRLVLMKSAFVLFDLTTLWIVIRLLSLTGRPIGLCVIYAWCPLLIKEIANSGHLDALAFCLTALSALLVTRVSYAPGTVRRPQTTAVAAAAILALAVGAKLYPVILVPLFIASLARRCGWRFALAPLAVFALISALATLPMWPGRNSDSSGPVAFDLAAFDPAQVEALPADAPPVPPQDVALSPRDPSQSLRAFLGEWEMNDFLFLLVIENLRPTADLPAGQVAWFSVLPERWRRSLATLLCAHFGIDERRAAFLAARALTMALFLVVALVLAFRASSARSAAEWLGAAFLTVAWFWLLLPTQNPWYWTWALPFLPFARSRVWLAVSGLALIYYVRFWLMHNFADTPLLGTRYVGPIFFDYVVTWLEFGPCLLVLFAESVWRRVAVWSSSAP